MSFLGRHVLVLILAAGLAQPASHSQSRDWAERLLSSDPKVAAAADTAIRKMGPGAIPLLATLLRHESKSVRRTAVDALIDLAPQTESIQPALRRALRDEDPVVAGDAARALGALGKRASPSVAALIKTLAHDDGYVRVYAAEALASIGPNAAT